MSLRLEKVTDEEEDFDSLIACQWESFGSPPQPFFSIFFPVLGSGPNARADSMHESTVRQLKWHQSDPTSHWQKIVDTETGEIAGGALWKICRRNPFEKAHDDDYDDDGAVVADWYPEGVQRDFMSQALEQYVTPRATMIPRAHVFLNILFTHPNHRRKGAGDLAMEWGLKKADELGLEMWIDATPLGLPLYQKHGLIVVHETVLEPKTEQPSDEWDRVKEEFGHVAVAHLWRPAYGKLREGQVIPKFPG